MKKVAQIKSGVAVATILSAGIGAAVLGFNIVMVEVSPAFKTWMRWSEGVGPLSGKSLVAMFAWLISWFVLHLLFKEKELEYKKYWRITLALIFIGWLGTFPPVFMAFSQH